MEVSERGGTFQQLGLQREGGTAPGGSAEAPGLGAGAPMRGLQNRSPRVGGSHPRAGVSLQGRQARGQWWRSSGTPWLRTSPDTGLYCQDQIRAGTGRRALEG